MRRPVAIKTGRVGKFSCDYCVLHPARGCLLVLRRRRLRKTRILKESTAFAPIYRCTGQYRYSPMHVLIPGRDYGHLSTGVNGENTRGGEWCTSRPLLVIAVSLLRSHTRPRVHERIVCAKGRSSLLCTRSRRSSHNLGAAPVSTTTQMVDRPALPPLLRKLCVTCRSPTYLAPVCTVELLRTAADFFAWSAFPLPVDFLFFPIGLSWS